MSITNDVQCLNSLALKLYEARGLNFFCTDPSVLKTASQTFTCQSISYYGLNRHMVQATEMMYHFYSTIQMPKIFGKFCTKEQHQIHGTMKRAIYGKIIIRNFLPFSTHCRTGSSFNMKRQIYSISVITKQTQLQPWKMA